MDFVLNANSMFNYKTAIIQ